MQKASSLQDRSGIHKSLPLVAFLIVASDQLSKMWIRHTLDLGESLPQRGFFRFTLVQNRGIVFGLPVNQYVPLILSVVMIAVVLLLSHKYPPFRNWPAGISLGLFLGGNVGNLIDRLRLGHVTDFIDIRLWRGYHWPTFNLADMAIVAGIIVLVCLVVRLGTSPKHE
ncbi:MAG: signal peptidase II [Chloroflexi bacterium]|nr:signal peptidase II [Chloroflexota bacterium]